MTEVPQERTRVLIVDDEVEFASTLAERLQLRGYDVTAVYCVEDAFNAIRQSPPDVLLLDLIMPGTSGMEALMTVKSAAPEIFVVLLTGHLDIEKELEGMGLENCNFIMKPVDISKLITMIDGATREMPSEKRLEAS
ncbi:MAG: response regulator [Desulfobulbaceae bacterium]|nr:response regulator [Desulfobulbaceae bacterium]